MENKANGVKGDPKKRSLEEETENHIGNTKKFQTFSARAFRKQLNQGNSQQVLQEFLTNIKTSKKHDYAVDYLQNGGSCLELLQLMEMDSTVSPVTVFELTTTLLLKINAGFPQYQNSANEACRYILNTYIAVINKMVSLSSTTPERKACLQLLTAIATFSSGLAKSILFNVNFNSANTELLTKQTGDDDGVRDHFVRFLTAFLVDGHYPVLSVLLEKKAFITSIVGDLQYDSADTVCIVISAMKNHILENPSVSKTVKMKTFNTVVIRNIVNLYNWKGPAAVKSAKKSGNVGPITVDEVEKSKVNECIHDFLLVLCTSHKFGVIFKDRLLGLGKKNQNALLYTVLESLDRPWDHSYASELVIKICGACPDLTRTVWNNLKQYAEPRLTQKWLNAMDFAKRLMKELNPGCIEFCVKELNSFQIFQVVQCLVAPLPILKTLIPATDTSKDLPIKQQIASLLSEVLTSLRHYLAALKSWLTPETFQKFKLHINAYVTKNFPNASTILDGWDRPEASDVGYVETAFELLDSYKTVAPELLESLNSDDLDLTQTLEKLRGNDKLQVKMIGIFVDLDQSKFVPKTELFSYSVNLLLKNYHGTKSAECFSVLRDLMERTGIFEGCEHEIGVWINCVLDVKRFDETLGDGIVETLRITDRHTQEFLDELSSANVETGSAEIYADLLRSLMDAGDAPDSVTVKHRHLSPSILGLRRHLKERGANKAMTIYSYYVVTNLLHCQTECGAVVQCIQTFDVLPSGFKEYAAGWHSGEETRALGKHKGQLKIFETFSHELLSGNVGRFLDDNEIVSYKDFPLNLLDMAVFYLSNTLKNKVELPHLIEGFETFVKHLIKSNLVDEVIIERIVGHPVFLQSVSFLQSTQFTGTLVGLVKHLLNSGYAIDNYLQVYRQKLVDAAIKFLRKPGKYDADNFLETLEMFSLGYEDCFKILGTLPKDLPQTSTNILACCLERIVSFYKGDLGLAPLPPAVVESLTRSVVMAMETSGADVGRLSSALEKYLTVFPHSIEYINDDLFDFIVRATQFNKENVGLAVFLLRRDRNLVANITRNVDVVCGTKGVILPLLRELVTFEGHENLLEIVYNNLEASLSKAIEKPQKIGQQFARNYEGLLSLIERFMPLEKCRSFLKKVQKYETTEPFHAKLFGAVCSKVITEGDITPKEINVVILNFVHLHINLLKRNPTTDEEFSKLISTTNVFEEVLTKLQPHAADMDSTNTSGNESFKLFCKFCLKFGVAGQPALLRCLRKLIVVLAQSLEERDEKLMLDMLVSHSEFLESVLEDHGQLKLEIWSLFLLLCGRRTEFMERSHVPVLLASYRALTHECDRVILALLKLYEKNANQTKFYDYKPFLWGRSAASHYSVRVSIENSLWRQPKTGDVLDILQEDLVTSTIKCYPFKENLRSGGNESCNKCYDLMFLLPLFSQLLATEQQVKTYKFSRSGALSLTVVSLSSQEREVRQAACHVLSRYYYHVEARQTGKDNMLWTRYVEAVCKGTAVLPDFRLNNFAAIYLARMSLILTQPNHVMYVPLSQHLTAKCSLDFSTVPELYTLLHSSDVNFREHRNFILRILKDGLRTDKDFAGFQKSMAFKLFSELYSSCLPDVDTRLLILDVIGAATKMAVGVKVLCENHSLLVQAYNMICDALLQDRGDEFVRRIVLILMDVTNVLSDYNSDFTVFSALKVVMQAKDFLCLVEKVKREFFQILYLIHGRHPELVNDSVMVSLLQKSRDSLAEYLYKYGCKYVGKCDLESDCEFYYLRLLTAEFKKRND